jgi:putative hemolysin
LGIRQYARTSTLNSSANRPRRSRIDPTYAQDRFDPTAWVLRPLTDVAPGTPIGQVFSLMMREHVHLVSIREPGGLLLGILALEDILEEIVGDNQDEFDRLPRRVEPSGPRWIVGGGATLGQIRSAVGERPELAGTDPKMVFADWLRLQRPTEPKGGEMVSVGGLRILVRKTRRKKMMDAMVSVEPAPRSDAGQ